MTILCLPTTKEEIEKLIKVQVQEGLHLDYKQSEAIADTKRAEIAKDVSAFANSDGGLIVYGLVEDKEKRLPEKIDEGIANGSKFNREWLENVIAANVAPKLEGVEISEIPITDDRSIFAVRIPKSYRGPHQERMESKRYYRRHNSKSEPMEDYEIREVRNRRRFAPPLINVEVRVKGFVDLIVSNPGDLLAQDIRFAFSEGMKWWEDADPPTPLKSGVKSLSPGRTLRFIYNSYQDLLQEESPASKRFEIDASYFHPELDQRINEVFHFDLRDFEKTILDESDIEIMTKKLSEELRSLVDEVKKVDGRLELLSKVASATGLDLSISTIENLRHVTNQDGIIEKLHPLYCSTQVFIDVLKVSREVAWNFANYFSGRGEAQTISQINGATEEVLEQFKHYFLWIEVEKPAPNNLHSVHIKKPKTRKSRSDF